MNINTSVILNTLRVPVISSFEHMAERLSLSEGLLYFLSFKKQYCYKKNYIPKKDGTSRELNIPIKELKIVQKWILVEILEKIRLSEQAMAFVPHKNGLKENAEYHKKNIFILEMDIHNFFGSINEAQIYDLFCKIGYNSKVAAILTNLCTYNNCLPQGAVTSPYIANLICYHLDSRLYGLCSRRDIVYTRYADDLSFSSSNRTQLNRIESFIKDIINDEGFTLNEKKTRYLSNYTKKTITGITINDEQLHVDKILKKNLRAMIYNSIVNKDYTKNEKIKGIIAYVSSIEDGYKEKICSYINHIIEKDILRGDREIVKSYNKNKFYKELKDMEYNCVK